MKGGGERWREVEGGGGRLRGVWVFRNQEVG